MSTAACLHSPIVIGGWRGLAGVLAAGGVLLALPSTSASAHSCATPVTLPAGRAVATTLAVTVGSVSTGDVTFQIPDTISVVDAPPVRGWEVERTDSSVRYVGGPLEPDSCVPFEMVLRGSQAGTGRVRVLQRLDDGSVTEHPAEGDIFVNEDGTSVVVDRSGPPNEFFEQIITVTGTAPAPGSSAGPVVGATVVAALGAGLWWWRRSHAR